MLLFHHTDKQNWIPFYVEIILVLGVYLVFIYLSENTDEQYTSHPK